MVAGDGEVRGSGGRVGRGGRGMARMDTATQGIPCSIEDGQGSLVVWIGGGGGELVDRRLGSGESLGGRTAGKGSPPAIQGSPGAISVSGGGSEGGGGGVVPEGGPGGPFIASRGCDRRGELR